MWLCLIDSTSSPKPRPHSDTHLSVPIINFTPIHGAGSYSRWVHNTLCKICLLWCHVALPKIRYSEGPVFRWSTIPKVQYSKCVLWLFRKARYFKSFLFWRYSVFLIIPVFTLEYRTFRIRYFVFADLWMDRICSIKSKISDNY